MLIVCGKCQTTIRVPEEAAGRQGRCPKCGFVIDVPSQAPETGYAADPLPPPLPSQPPPLPRPSRRDDDEPVSRRGRYRRDDDDDDDLFERAMSIRTCRRQGSIGLSLAGMVLGLTGLVFLIGTIAVSSVLPAVVPDPGVCCFSILGGYTGLILAGVVAILGTVFSFVGMRRGGIWYAWTGAISSIVTLTVVILFIVLTLLFGVVMFMGIVFVAAAAAQPPPPNGPPMRRR